VTTEGDLRNNMAMLENARAQLDALSRQQELIQLAVEEHVRARETVKKTSGASEDSDTLVPVGADTYIHAKISDKNKIVLGVGAGISIQRTPEETERILDGKIDELSQAFKKISERASQLESMINELSDKIQNEYAAMQTPDKT